MKAETLAALLREEAEVWHATGNDLPRGDDTAALTVANALDSLADKLDMVED